MKKFNLIIVDFQNDFYHVNGSMKVNGAYNALINIIEFIIKNHNNINEVYLTRDAHPQNHISFKENDGLWPKHCVKGEWGYQVAQDILDIIEKYNLKYEYVDKGVNQYIEEYGAFQYSIPEQLMYYNNVVCGIAGDYCVAATLENLIDRHVGEIKIFKDGIVSIESDEKINKLIKEHNLKIID